MCSCCKYEHVIHLTHSLTQSLIYSHTVEQRNSFCMNSLISLYTCLYDIIAFVNFTEGNNKFCGDDDDDDEEEEEE